MANISDTHGEIVVEKIGKEFLEFLEVAQKDAYYRLVEDVLDVEPDENGDLSFEFYAGGRWHYENNLNGYLGGEWMNDDKTEEAHGKLMEAIEEKDGLIQIEYSDSDMSNGWMGTGAYEVWFEEGRVQHAHTFSEEEATIESFAKLNGESELWAIEYIYGDEAADAYEKYTKDCHDKGVEPVEAETWINEIYEEE